MSAMTNSYTITRISTPSYEQTVTLPGGGTAQALVQYVEVEMTSNDGMSGSILLDFTGTAATNAQQNYSVGQTVSATFA